MQATLKTLLAASLLAMLFSCAKPQETEQHRKEANTPAGKVGQVAYSAAKVSGKVAKAAAKELSKAAHEAHEGWKEASQKDKAKQ